MKTDSNKPGTAKVGATSKAQNCKRGDHLGFVKFQLVAKYEKKTKGDPWEILKKFRKLLKNENVPKNVKRDPLGFFDIHCVAKYRNKRRGDLLEESKKLQKCFRFGRGSGVSSMSWRSVVQVDDVEQINKKIGPITLN